MESKVLNELIKLANHLDSRGLVKEADYLDRMIKKAKALTVSGAEKLLDNSDFKKKLKNINSTLKEFTAAEPSSNLAQSLIELPSNVAIALYNNGNSWIRNDEEYGDPKSRLAKEALPLLKSAQEKLENLDPLVSQDNQDFQKLGRLTTVLTPAILKDVRDDLNKLHDLSLEFRGIKSEVAIMRTMLRLVENYYSIMTHKF